MGRHFDRFKMLVKELQHLRREYYNKGTTEVPDSAYDSLERECRALLQKYPELRRLPEAQLLDTVGAAVPDGSKKVRFPSKLLSLDNALSEEDFAKFQRRVQRVAGSSASLCLEPKWDGVSLVLYYRGGTLVCAATRGDGIIGEDVTPQVRALRCVPKNINWSDELWVRGELLFPLFQFEHYNEEQRRHKERTFTSPRNAVAGALRLKDEEEVARYPLVLTCYDVVSDRSLQGVGTQKELLEFLKRIGLPVLYPPRVTSLQEARRGIALLWSVREKLGIPVDGIAAKVNDLTVRKELGQSPKAPHWAVAVKFESEAAVTTLREVEIQIGRTGVLTPVAVFDPVELSGATLERASLYNFGFVESLDLRLGDKIKVTRSGEVIPKVLGVAERSNGSKVERPAACPFCGTPTLSDGFRLHGHKGFRAKVSQEACKRRYRFRPRRPLSPN